MGLLNSNGTNDVDVKGENLFECEFVDGYFHRILRAQGSRSAGDIYAKQFAGDRIRVYGISQVKIEIEKL